MPRKPSTPRKTTGSKAGSASSGRKKSSVSSTAKKSTARKTGSKPKTTTARAAKGSTAGKSKSGRTTARKSTSRATKAKSTRTAAGARDVETVHAPPTKMEPGARRAIFIDVENTSSEDTLARALEELDFDLQSQNVDFVAVGNWRVISNPVARTLAARGARLVHSAPAAGVRDWSDLAIAVHAGIWLGRSSPGDVLEIVSGDKAFDAVADIAATLGVQYRRLFYDSASPTVEKSMERRSRRRRRGGRRRRRRSPADSEPAALSPQASAGPEPKPAPPPRRAVPRPPAKGEASPRPASGTPREATPDEIRATIARLGGTGGRGVNVDQVIQELKAQGFSRPPGSLRLVTRLRRMANIEVSSTGMVRLTDGAAAPRSEPQEASEPTSGPEKDEPGSARRSGGRRRGRRRRKDPGEAHQEAQPERERESERENGKPAIDVLPGERLSILGDSSGGSR